MFTEMLPMSHPETMEIAMEELKKGSVIAVPTDTVYGIACLLENESAIHEIFRIKERDTTKAIPLLIGEYEQIICTTDGISESAQKLAKRFWPGPLTLVIPKRLELPEVLTPYPTVGVRMPAHTWLCQLIRNVGVLAATSANISGGENPRTAQDVLRQLDGHIPLIIDGGACEGGIPSTVVDCSQEEITILRTGGISEDKIRQALSGS
jgi:L-threonylcarbamoyladenylate synthase